MHYIARIVRVVSIAWATVWLVSIVAKRAAWFAEAIDAERREIKEARFTCDICKIEDTMERMGGSFNHVCARACAVSNKVPSPFFTGLAAVSERTFMCIDYPCMELFVGTGKNLLSDWRGLVSLVLFAYGWRFIAEYLAWVLLPKVISTGKRGAHRSACGVSRLSELEEVTDGSYI
jgi:hypothetical protein